MLVFTGKSLAAWYALCFLSVVKSKIVVYYPLKSAGTESESCFAILMGHFVLQVTARLSESLLDVFKKFLDQVLLAVKPVDLKLDCLFLDGFFHEDSAGGMKVLAQRLQDSGQNVKLGRTIPFLGATTSMMHQNGCFSGAHVKQHHSEPWDLEDYIELVRAIYNAGKTLSRGRLDSLGCVFSDTLGAIEKAIRLKFPIAGHSCRFMLDYTSTRVTAVIKGACDTARFQGCLSNSTQNAARIKNTY